MTEAEEALKQNPDDLNSRRLLARIYTRLIGDAQANRIDENMVKKAIEQYQKITAGDPKDLESWVMLGRLDKVAQNSTEALAAILNTEEGSSIWETWLLVSKLTLLIDQCINTSEPAYLAKYAFQLAQQFNNFYHRHHILNETDPTRKALYLATAAAAQREMIRALAYLGIEAPPVM